MGERGREGERQENVVNSAADFKRLQRIMLKSRILYMNSYCVVVGQV